MTEKPDTAPSQNDTDGAGSPDGATGEYSALYEQLPDDIKKNPSLSSYSSLEGLMRSHLSAQHMIGKRIEDAKPEELGRFYARHGRPETPDGYVFSGADSDQEQKTPGEFEQTARAWLHEAGLSQHQAEILHDKWTEYASVRLRDSELGSEAARTEAEHDLRAEWGRAYDRRVASASRAVAEFGGQELIQYLEESGLGDDPRMVRAFAQIAEKMGEDSLIGEGDGEFSLAPDEAKSEIARVLQEPAYFDANHREHGASVERMRELFSAAYPEMSA